MAPFTQEVAPGQDKMPSFLKGYSEPISQPKADDSGEYSGKAKGMALATAGKAFEGVAELADQTVKGVIKSDVYSRVDPLTDGYIDALKTLKANPTGLGPAASVSNDPTDTTDATPVEIMKPTDPNVPPGLAAGLSNIQRLGAAQASGKPSNTEIDMKLYAQLKDLRATYPGWREYVDATMQKATGKDIANELVNSLRTDIAQRATAANKETEFWKHQIVNNSGFPGSEKMLNQYNATGDSNKVMQWLAFNQGQLNALALKKAQFESQGQDEKTQITNATNYATAAANHAATIAFANDKLLSSQGGLSPAQIADRMYDLTMHPEKANDPAYQNLSAQYEATKAKTYTQTTMLLNQRPKLADGTLGKSVADIIGPEATKKIVNDSVGALFEKTSDYIKDKQFGPAYTMQAQAEGVQSNTLVKVLRNNTIGDKVAVAGAITKLFPMMTGPILGEMMGKGFDTELNTLITAQKGNAMSNQGGKYIGQDGQQYSFKQSLEELDHAAAIRGEPIPGEAYNSLLKVTKGITDPTSTPEGKHILINHFFDPTVNKGTMSKFMDDYYDEAKGGMVKGRSSAFATLTSPELTKAIRTTAESGYPNDWAKYSTWAKGEAFGLIRNSVSDLNSIANDPTSSYNISWDSKNTKLLIKNKDGSELTGMQATSANQAYRTAQNLNMVLGNLSNIAKTEGSNIDAYVFNVLKTSGFSPTRDVEGVPAQIMKAMIASKGYKVKPAEPASKFQPEEPPSNLQSFLTNPAGPQPRPEASQLESYQTRGIIKGNLSDQPMDAPIRTLR